MNIPDKNNGRNVKRVSMFRDIVFEVALLFPIN